MGALAAGIQRAMVQEWSETLDIHKAAATTNHELSWGPGGGSSNEHAVPCLALVELVRCALMVAAALWPSLCNEREMLLLLLLEPSRGPQHECCPVLVCDGERASPRLESQRAQGTFTASVPNYMGARRVFAGVSPQPQ